MNRTRHSTRIDNCIYVHEINRCPQTLQSEKIDFVCGAHTTVYELPKKKYEKLHGVMSHMP